MRVLHAIHDFLPRHRAGSELYAWSLAREQRRRGLHVTVLCAEYDFSRRHGEVTWRVFDELPVVEVVNNWAFDSFEESYRSPYLDDRLGHVLRAVQPDVVHVHNLLNLSFNLPALAQRRGAAVVATLHDYTLVCPSGGQRVHVAEEHVCREIDPERCARCFPESPFGAQLRFGRLRARGVLGMAGRAAAAARRALPRAFDAMWQSRPRTSMTAADIRARLEALRDVYDHVDRFVAPSQALADDMIRFGLPAGRISVSDYGFPSLARPLRTPSARLRVGFVGTVVWHKGVHVLIDAVKRLPQDRIDVLIYGDPGTFPGYGGTLQRTAPPAVKWKGAFDERMVSDVFAGLDVLVVPSLWPENSPLVVHEAFMAGVPVVAAAVGGIPGLVADEVSGLLYDPASAADLALCLSRLLDDRALLDRLSSSLPAVRSIAEDANDWQRIYETCSTSAFSC